MIEITCHRCNRVLEEFGGLLFSPPDNDKRCFKRHLCESCYHEVYLFIIGDT